MMRGYDSSDRITHFLSHLDGQFSVQNSMAILNPVAPVVRDFNEKKEHDIGNGGKVHGLGIWEATYPLAIVLVIVVLDDYPSLIEVETQKPFIYTF